MPIDLSAVGLIETQRRLKQAAADLHGQPMVSALERAGLAVRRDAQIFAPRDTGRLANSINNEVRVQDRTVVSAVGSPVVYAAAMEVGAKPHWVNVADLEPWARRHGMNAFLVARAISKRGIQGRRYLQRAFDKNKPFIIRTIGDAVTGIVQKANGGG